MDCRALKESVAIKIFLCVGDINYFYIKTEQVDKNAKRGKSQHTVSCQPVILSMSNGTHT